MFFNRNKSKKELINQLRKENEQLKKQNDYWQKLYMIDKDFRKSLDDEKELWKKLSAEANERLKGARKLLAENKAINRELNAMKVCYKNVLDELNEVLNACREK